MGGSSSYHLLTKCGRYGTKAEDFDYSRQRVTRSVAESCTKLVRFSLHPNLQHLDALARFSQGTDYLDAVYLHDVEFVASDVGSASFGGDDLSVIESGSHSDLARWGLAEGQEAIVWGKGDERVLEGVGALFEMQKAGKVRKVGISGPSAPSRPHLTWTDVQLQATRYRRCSASPAWSATVSVVRSTSSCPTRTTRSKTLPSPRTSPTSSPPLLPRAPRSLKSSTRRPSRWAC